MQFDLGAVPLSTVASKSVTFQNPTVDFETNPRSPYVPMSPCPFPTTPKPSQPEVYECDENDSPKWTTLNFEGSLQPRARPAYVFLTGVARLEQSSHMADVYEDKLTLRLLNLKTSTKKPDVAAHLRAAEFLALHTQKDTGWKRELSDPKTRDLAIRALADELASLQSTILTRVHVDDPEYEQALELACTCRIIIARKRIGCYKARGVK